VWFTNNYRGTLQLTQVDSSPREYAADARVWHVVCCVWVRVSARRNNVPCTA
jgi:hypothetical protein